MKLLRALALVLGLYALPAAAHEFWLWPQSFALGIGSLAQLTLHVGQNFEGELAGFTSSHAARMRHYGLGHDEDLRARLPNRFTLPEFRLSLTRPGVHLVTYDSIPGNITLPSDKFHDYLRDEGLESVMRQREADGKAALPGRERYRRCIKTLLQVDETSDTTSLLRVGQRLEIVPLADPYSKAAGDTLSFQLLFDGRPLSGALVKAWHKHDKQLVLVRARTLDDGSVALTLPYAGPWMISAVHMIAAGDTANADWDSFWSNLTFALNSKR